MTPIVTVADENYLPGLTALYNSYKKHSADGFEFWAILRGSKKFVAKVKRMGIKVIHEPDFPVKQFPTSVRYPDQLPLFYWRLLVPDLFPNNEYSFFIDCDSLILQSLKPLLDGGTHNHPVAATRSNSPKGQEFGPAGSEEHATDTYGPMSSLYLYNHKEWTEKRVFERLVEAMNDKSMVFHTVAQGLAQYVLGDDWHCWPWQTQAHAGHATMEQYPARGIYTLHYLGTNPWCEFKPNIHVTELKRKNRALWQTYYQ